MASLFHWTLEGAKLRDWLVGNPLGIWPLAIAGQTISTKKVYFYQNKINIIYND